MSQKRNVKIRKCSLKWIDAGTAVKSVWLCELGSHSKFARCGGRKKHLSALEVLRNRALQIDIYYLLTCFSY